MAGETNATGGGQRTDRLMTGLKDALSGGKGTEAKPGLLSQLEVQNDIAKQNADLASKANGIGNGGFLV